MVLRVFENEKKEWLTLRELFEWCKVRIDFTGYDFKIKKNIKYNRIYRYSRIMNKIVPSMFVVKETIPDAKKEDTVCENISYAQVKTSKENLKDSVIKILNNLKDCISLSTKYINGYYVRTIFEKRIEAKEICIKVLVVYENADSNEVVQISVDVENLYGVLLSTDAFDGKDFNEIADCVVHDAFLGD